MPVRLTTRRLQLKVFVCLVVYIRYRTETFYNNVQQMHIYSYINPGKAREICFRPTTASGAVTVQML